MEISFLFGQNTNVLFKTTSLKEKIEEGDVLSSFLDTISSKKMYVECFWTIEEVIDTVNQEINVQISVYDDYWGAYSINYRNVFRIDITKNNNIYVNDSINQKFDSLLNDFRTFIVNPEDDDNLPQKKKVIIPHFDTVLLTKHAFLISTVFVEDENGIKTSFQSLNSVCNVILQNYLDLRNDLSQFEWNKSFHELSFENKIAIIHYFPLRIWIYPNRPRIPPPPPSRNKN